MKLKHLFFTAALPLIVSCGGKGKEVRDDSACGSASDTVLPVNIEIEDTPADSIPPYNSDDLRKFGLRGKVKTVRTKEYSPFVTCISGPLQFNEDGSLSSRIDELTANRMVFNDNGIFNGTECRESDGTVFRLALTDYVPEGNPVSGTYTSDGPDEIWEVEFSISYLKFDKEGNWTERLFKGTSSTRQMKDNGEYSAPTKENFEKSETRAIIYY